MALEKITFPIGEKSSKIIEWKVKHGSLVSKGRILLHYTVDSGGGSTEIQKLKASKVGTVKTVLAAEGATIKPGDVLLEMESCSHPTVMRDLCAECGADLSNEKQTASVPMVHCVPELKVSLEQAQKLGRADEERLLSHRKLVLLVDLDQTLIHTTNDDIPPNLKDVHHFQLYGSGSPWYHTRLRPLTLKFLHDVSSLYELHICTFGARSYAHTIAKILDPDEKLFSHRILSRDECFDPNSKTANLTALFPCGDHMVCIIDDREDVWNFAPNLIAVKPYHFFQHTGDIHAPPGLDKHEQDGLGYTQPANTEESSPQAQNTSDDAAPSNVNTEEASPESKEPTAASESLGKAEESNPSQVAETGGTTEDEKPKDDEKAALEKTESEDKDTAESINKEVTTKIETSEQSDSSSKDEQAECKTKENKSAGDTLIEIQDPDDYLLYLQEILERIHTSYYKHFDEDKKVPNMREIVPDVKRQILANQSLVFSGVVPTHVPLANSRSAQTARSLGARVTEQIIPGETTHLVAARPGTAKVNEARRAGTGIHLVSPEWLSCTAERWERAEERLFPISRTSKRGISEHGSRLSNSSLVESLNPLLALSSEDLKSMDQEVEDIFNETDDESAMDRDADSEEDEEEEESEDKVGNLDVPDLVADLKTDDGTDDEQEKEEVSANRQRKRSHDFMEDLGDLEQEDEEDEPTMKLFKDADYTETPTSDAEEDLIDSGDESELSKMGLALEREFLAD